MSRGKILTPEEFLNIQDYEVNSIPAMKYNKTLKEEIESGNLTKEDAIELYSQMKWLRTFEQMLLTFKTEGTFNGKEFDYVGPAHTEIGEEGALVGANFLTNEDDFVFGPHRSHGEVLTKGFTAIYRMEDSKIEEVIKSHNDGKTYNAIKNFEGFDNLTIKEQARLFYIYGMQAEIYSRDTGLNKGIAGSLHMFFTKFGSYPNNGVVGGSFSFGLGASLYKLVNNKPGMGISFIGDGGISTGPVWEALNFASMDQYKELWKQGKRPPFMINILNNSYAITAQTLGETMGNKGPARMGLAANPEGAHAEVANGQNVLAVVDLIRRKRPLVENGDGPVINEIRTYRFEGHGNSRQFEGQYRTDDEIAMWENNFDPILLFKDEMINSGFFVESEINAIDDSIISDNNKIFDLASDETISPFIPIANDEKYLDNLIFSREERKIKTDVQPDVLTSIEENEKYSKLQNGDRTQISYAEAMYEPILERFYKDPEFVVFSQDVSLNYAGMDQSIPKHRLFNTPITEAAMVGTAIGYAMAGGQALVQLTVFDFMFRAGDEISSQLSKWRAMSGGMLKLSVIIRTTILHNLGTQHSQDYTSVLANISGMNVSLPATPYDIKGIMNRALSLDDPSFIVQDAYLFGTKEKYNQGGVPKESYSIEYGEPKVRVEGSDITIVSVGQTLAVTEKAVEELKKYNINAELIDMRFAVPFNYEKVLESVRKTGHAVFVNNGFERSNIMKQVSQTVTELEFESLKKAPITIGARNWIAINGGYEDWIYPQVDNILSAINDRIFNIEGYESKRDHSKAEQIRRNKIGV